jgi:hypothetical protein
VNALSRGSITQQSIGRKIADYAGDQHCPAPLDDGRRVPPDVPNGLILGVMYLDQRHRI